MAGLSPKRRPSGRLRVATGVKGHDQALTPSMASLALTGVRAETWPR